MLKPKQNMITPSSIFWITSLMQQIFIAQQIIYITLRITKPNTTNILKVQQIKYIINQDQLNISFLK